jgi:hypothetical protein
VGIGNDGGWHGYGKQHKPNILEYQLCVLVFRPDQRERVQSTSSFHFQRDRYWHWNGYRQLHVYRQLI